MAAPNSRRRRRSATCAAPSRRRSGGMATTAAVSLLALLHSSSVDAFAPPLSAIRLPQHSFTELSQSSAATMAFDGEPSSSYPIRANQPLTRLTQQQEISLLKQMRSHPASSSMSQMARQTLMLHNLPLVQSIVTKILRSRPHLRLSNKGGESGEKVWQRSTPVYSKKSEARAGAALTRDDLLHEGTIGLAEAIDRYDLAYAVDSSAARSSPEKATSSVPSASIIPQGARLGTYATYWIRARILRAIQSREHVIRFPEHVLQASHRLVKASQDMGIEWDAVVELADFDVITVTQMKLRDGLIKVAGIKSESLFREAVRVRSLSQSGSTTPLESWMSPSALTASADELPSLEEGGGQEHIRDTLAKFLMPREVEVLSLRYGLVSADETEEEEVRVFRDYQAEAEEDLFGPDGVLSHYSDTPADGIAAVASTSKSANRVASAASVPRMTKKAATPPSPTALLPFKEIGKRMKFSGEYCRRTCAEALDKLTRAVEEGRLAESDFLLGWET